MLDTLKEVLQRTQKDGWTANFKSPGWYGIWEAQVYQSTKLGMGNVNIAKMKDIV